jgi:hypothetical protein
MEASLHEVKAELADLADGLHEVRRDIGGMRQDARIDRQAAVEARAASDRAHAALRERVTTLEKDDS